MALASPDDHFYERYETVRKLGSGNYGTVFVVRDKITSAKCVLKKIVIKDTMDDEGETNK